jgi:hypothetical protein
MSTLTSNIRIIPSATLTGTVGLVSPSVNTNTVISKDISSTQGTFLYTDDVAIETANKTYDLIGAGAGTDPFGVAVDMDRIAALVVENTHATAYLHITGLPAAMIKGTTPTLIIPPGGAVALAAGAGWANTTNLVITGRNAADNANATATWKVLAIGKHE